MKGMIEVVLERRGIQEKPEGAGEPPPLSSSGSYINSWLRGTYQPTSSDLVLFLYVVVVGCKKMHPTGTGNSCRKLKKKHLKNTHPFIDCLWEIISY